MSENKENQLNILKDSKVNNQSNCASMIDDLLSRVKGSKSKDS